MKPELLAPAGNFDKLKFAIEYGADAIYMGCPGLSLRTYAEKYGFDVIEESCNFAHSRGAKLYIAVNIFAYNSDLETAKDAIAKLKDIDIDGLIVSDLGIIDCIKGIWPDAPIHISTQTNSTNYKTVGFWEKYGAKRVCLARELNLQDIKKICLKSGVEIEMFVHGAMCISYSGRCYLSKYMSDREANKGDCAHSCRWSYDIVESMRPGEYYNIMEDGRGTYIMNSKDLCLAKKIPALIDAGVNAFKIEGRMKSAHYIAVVTSVYRRIIDEYMKNSDSFEFNGQWMEDLESVSHRKYTEGFIGGDPADMELTDNFKPLKGADFTGVIRKEAFSDNGVRQFEIDVKNHIDLGDDVEFFTSDGKRLSQKIDYLFNINKNMLAKAANPNDKVIIKSEYPLKPLTIIRRPNY